MNKYKYELNILIWKENRFCYKNIRCSFIIYFSIKYINRNISVRSYQ